MLKRVGNVGNAPLKAIFTKSCFKYVAERAFLQPQPFLPQYALLTLVFASILLQSLKLFADGAISLKGSCFYSIGGQI